MSSKEIAVIGDAELSENGSRRAALERLNEDAESASSPAEAREVMLKGAALKTLLQQARAPLEEARLAGKASTVAARRLGALLGEIDGESKRMTKKGAQGFVTSVPSDRSRAMDDVGIKKTLGRSLVRLAGVADPEFQRYIQRTDLIPSVYGALSYANIRPIISGTATNNPKARRRRRVGVKVPKNPSVDEAYSLIVRALGHLSGVDKGGPGTAHIGVAARSAMDNLYVAEDILKPFRGGYTK